MGSSGLHGRLLLWRAAGTARLSNGSQSPMTLIVQISDTHFGTEVPAVVAALRSTIDELRPDVVALCGDITQRGRHGQFEAAADFFKSLPARHRLAIPGNHDIPLLNVLTRAFSPYGDYERSFGEREPLWFNDDLALIGFDATDPRRHKDGKLVIERIAPVLEKVRAQSGERVLVVCAHQPLHTTWEKDRKQVLIEATATAKVFAEHRVDLVLSGHVHVPMIMSTSAPFPALQRHFVLSGSGTALSYRTRRGVPNSFNTLGIEARSDARCVVITQYDFQATEQTFQAVRKASFCLGAAGWLNRNIVDCGLSSGAHA
jgi:3',5'-cyclic AMP phosphodiesterase CpdA